MQTFRVSWLLAWLLAALTMLRQRWSLGVVDYANLWCASGMVCVGLLGFFLLRWKRVAFTRDPRALHGASTRESGRDVFKPWYPIEYLPGEIDGPLFLVLHHPGSVQLVGVWSAIGGSRGDHRRTWPLQGEGSPLRRGWWGRATKIRIRDHRFSAGEALILLVQNDGSDLPASRLRLYRSS